MEEERQEFDLDLHRSYVFDATSESGGEMTTGTSRYNQATALIRLGNSRYHNKFPGSYVLRVYSHYVRCESRGAIDTHVHHILRIFLFGIGKFTNVDFILFLVDFSIA